MKTLNIGFWFVAVFLSFNMGALRISAAPADKGRDNCISITHSGIIDKPIRSIFIVTNKEVAAKTDYRMIYVVDDNEFERLRAFVVRECHATSQMKPSAGSGTSYGTFEVSCASTNREIEDFSFMLSPGVSALFFRDLLSFTLTEPADGMLVDQVRDIIDRLPPSGAASDSRQK